MRLQTERQGRALAVRTLRKLAKAGTEACRANVVPGRESQCGAFRAALHKLLRIGTQQARDGFSSVMTDALGVRRYCSPLELSQLYERMQAEKRFRERHHQQQGSMAEDNGDRMPAKAEPDPSPR